MIARRAFLAFALLLSFASAAHAEQPFTADAFADAQKAGKGIVVHVYAPWCPTCRAQEPVLQKLEADHPELVGFRVDFDGQKDAVKALKARNQSTIIVFKGANEVGRSVGESDAASIGKLVAKAL